MKKWYFILDEQCQVMDITTDDTGHFFDELDEALTIEKIKEILDFSNRNYSFKDSVLTSERKSENYFTDDYIKTIIKQELASANLSSGLFSEANRVKVTVTGPNTDFRIRLQNEFAEPPIITFALLDPTTNRTVVIKEVTTTSFTLKSSYFRQAQEVHYTATGKLKEVSHENNT